MTVDCQWLEKNLEALFCETLSPEQNRMARAHIDNCDSCGKEVAALKAIDPLVKAYFQNELNRALKARASSGRRLPASRVLGLSSAALIAASLLLVFTLRTPTQQPAVPAASPVSEATEAQPPEATPLVKSSDAPLVERAKPDASEPAERPQIPRATAATGKGAPQFLVTDPAGYSRTLNDYRGHVLIIGVLNSPERTGVKFRASLQGFWLEFEISIRRRFHRSSTETRRYDLPINLQSRLDTFWRRAGRICAPG